METDVKDLDRRALSSRNSGRCLQSVGRTGVLTNLVVISPLGLLDDYLPSAGMEAPLKVPTAPLVGIVLVNALASFFFSVPKHSFSVLRRELAR